MNDPATSIWKIDSGHSAVQFKVKHVAIANVWGSFNAFEGTVQTDRDDFEGAHVYVDIEANSLSTNNDVRDTHLKSDVFFDALRFPKLTFSGTLQKIAGEYALAGDLTIRGTSRAVTLEAAYTGTGNGRFGEIRAGFEVQGQINRSDFGLTWNMLTEAGGMVVGENIKLQMDVELIKE